MAATGINPTYITIETADGTQRKVDRRTADRSGFIKEFLAIVGELTEEDVLPVYGCNSYCLKAVLDWCVVHQYDPDKDESTAATPPQEDDATAEWDRQFLLDYRPLLDEIAQAATYLRVHQLHEYCSRASRLGDIVEVTFVTNLDRVFWEILTRKRRGSLRSTGDVSP